MRRRRFVSMLPLIACVAAIIACKSPDGARPSDDVRADVPTTLLIQPYTGLSAADGAIVKRGIERLYKFEVEVLPVRDLPASAYYAPRRRYRAAMLLEDLNEIGVPTSKIIGLTSVDISVLRAETQDWGIFGYGMIGGRACVVSGYRLRSGGAERALYEARLQKVANHEVGHTLGLEHCDQESCLMQDAAGKISTIDKISGSFCETCEAALAQLSVLRRISEGPSRRDARITGVTMTLVPSGAADHAPYQSSLRESSSWSQSTQP